MSQTLRDFITEIDKSAVARFNKHGGLRPQFHVTTESGEHIMTTPSDDKDLSAMLMRVYFALLKVERYCFVDEAWQLEADAGIGETEIRRMMARGLHDHPDRTEIIMYSAEDRSGQLTAHRVITRQGGKPKLGPLEFTDDVRFSEGRLVGMLPPRGKMQ